MLGGLLVVTLAGLAAWKYRDSLREYVKGNTGPAREKVDGLLLTAQQAVRDAARPSEGAHLFAARERSGEVKREGERQSIAEYLPSSSYSRRGLSGKGISCTSFMLIIGRVFPAWSSVYIVAMFLMLGRDPGGFST